MTANVPLDYDFLSRQTFGDRVLQHELLALFRDQASDILSSIRQLGEGDLQQKADLAHKLKGAALAIGAVGVAEAARGYEEALTQPLPAQGLALVSLSSATGEALDSIASYVNP